MLKDFLRGRVTGTNLEELGKLLPKKKMMVFVSSTFLDTNFERDVLHRKILPDLQSAASVSGIEIVFYDMRFGVKDENTKDHMTWISCKEAIEQCYNGSDGLFFLSLQGDRYGYLPLPKFLDQETLSKAMKMNKFSENLEEIKTVLKEWYILDSNHCPPRFELKALTVNNDGTINDPEYWNHVLPLLRDSLLDSIEFDSCPSLPGEALLVNRSVTEWETLFGLGCSKERCYWMQRSFDKKKLKAFSEHANFKIITDAVTNSPSAEGPPSRSLVEVMKTKIKSYFSRSPHKSVALKLDILKAKMKSYLKEDKRCELSCRISPEQYFTEMDRIIYLKEWEGAVRNCLEKDLERIKTKNQEWIRNCQTDLGIPSEFVEDILFHCKTAYMKAKSFLGRDELKERALKYFQNSSTGTKSILQGLTFALIGKSGCGKTALMSKLAMEIAASTVEGPPVIIRFCGTSQNSLNGLRLIQSITFQILAFYERKEELKEMVQKFPSQDYKTAVEYFQKLLEKNPVFLFIDSVDQLENRNEERSKLSFLRKIPSPNRNSRIVVSALPDDYNEDGQPGKYYYQCEATLKLNNIAIMEVETMSDISRTLERLLFAQKRKLTVDQSTVVLSAASYEPTILYINLALEVISQWRSFDKDVVLKPTVKGLIHQIFETLEKNFGPQFTSASFAMITFSREGINDTDMQDLLSLHEAVLKEVFQYSTLHCFPIHVWLRLKHVIKNLVVEKEYHCIKWYHRQLHETAAERYAEKESHSHVIMGRFFSNLVTPEEKENLAIHSQPLAVNQFSLWLPECIVNRRRVIEGYYHLIKAGLWEEAIEEMCSLEFVCASGSSCPENQTRPFRNRDSKLWTSHLRNVPEKFSLSCRSARSKP
jgi:flagellar biosynthesis GTPase FlhF